MSLSLYAVVCKVLCHGLRRDWKPKQLGTAVEDSVGSLIVYPFPGTTLPPPKTTEAASSVPTDKGFAKYRICLFKLGSKYFPENVRDCESKYRAQIVSQSCSNCAIFAENCVVNRVSFSDPFNYPSGNSNVLREGSQGRQRATSTQTAAATNWNA